MSCIIHSYTQDNEGLIEVQQYDSIDEINYFGLLVESEFELKNHVILITDIPIELVLLNYTSNKFWYTLDSASVKLYFQSQNFDKVFDLYKKDFFISKVNKHLTFYKVFINYPIGQAEIVLYNKLSQEIVKNSFLNIISAKINESEFSSLVSYVESRGSSIWAKYSLLKHTADKFDTDDKMEWLMLFCENFVVDFQSKYLEQFNYDKIKILNKIKTLVDYSYDTNVSEDSIFWLLENLDTLNTTVAHDNNKLLINNRLFSPREILTSELQEDTDTNENQIVHGFFNEMTRYLLSIKYIYEDNIKNCPKDSFKNLVNFYSYTRSVKRLKNIIQSLINLKFKLENYIPVSKETLDFLNTNKIESKEHYSFVFDKLIEWLLYKDAIFSQDKEHFKGINRMDHLFERACFYKLIDAFESLGYQAEEILFDADSFPNKVKMTNNGKTHWLYSQVIPDKLTTVKKGSGMLQPDFTIELANGKFIILDAKYKKDKNISRYDYPELTLKYLHGIGFKNGGLFDPIGLFILYPDNEKTIDFYHKSEFNIYGKNPIFPSIGSVALNFDEESTGLISILQKLLNFSA